MGYRIENSCFRNKRYCKQTSRLGSGSDNGVSRQSTAHSFFFLASFRFLYWPVQGDGIYRADLASGSNAKKIKSISVVSRLSVDYRNNSTLYYLSGGRIDSITTPVNFADNTKVLEFDVTDGNLFCFHNKTSSGIIYATPSLGSNVRVGDDPVFVQATYFSEAQPHPGLFEFY